VSAQNKAAAELDFVVRGGETPEPVRFNWKLDNDTLKDINRAIGLDAAAHGRGFLGRLMLLWLSLEPEARPRLEVPRMRHDDLMFVPSPCYIVALADDGRRINCWYSVLVDAQPSELLDHKRGVWVFEVEGEQEFIQRYLDCIVKTFRLRTRQQAEGHTFFRMI
jgi:hypothetical protein